MEFNKLKIVTSLEERGKKLLGSDAPTVAVGYEAEYALRVHEDVEMKLKGQPRPSGIGEYWGPHGEAKFLEKPARVNQKTYAGDVREGVKRGLPLSDSLMLAALHLQRDSQELVPVEYGNLKASAFTKVEQ